MVKTRSLIPGRNNKSLGFELPGSIWIPLNRIRTDQGKSNHLLHKSDFSESSISTCVDELTVKEMVI